jgi:formate C-acetyltransferase
MMSLERLRQELRDYYGKHSFRELGGSSYRSPLCAALDAYASAHPGLSAVQLKAAQYEIIAEAFSPVIFKNSPFYAEMGVKVAEYDGVPGLGAGGWLFTRNAHLFRDANPAEHSQFMAAGAKGIHLAYSPYADYDHHCFPYSNVIKRGLGQICEQAETSLKRGANREEVEFMECARRGLLAVRKISEKFAAAAENLQRDAEDEAQRRFLGRIATTAREVPWRKPETFYEGLCAVWFLHEVCASIEGIGMSVIGHLDRMLGELFRRDLEAGRLSPEEAYDLVCRFMVHTDGKLDLRKPVKESFNGQEQGDTLILGGCDENGGQVCNEITFMVLKAHHEHKLIYPKIHCRISRNTKPEFLDAINRDFLSGRNVISFLSDDAVIPAQVKAGKRLEDARGYVAGGCWEIILEGYEHSAGANCYFSLSRIMDLSIHERPELAATGVVCAKLDGAQDFAEVYRIVLDNAIRGIRQMCAVIGRNGRVWPQVSPAPFFSACLSDCLEKRTDYTAGGGRYNPHGLPLAGFAIFVDSLLAIRTLCFERGPCRLNELLKAVRADWDGYANLRAEALTMPHFGDDRPESNALARLVLDDLYANTRDLKNERGGPFQLGLYNYRDIIDWAKITGATPDGRRAGDFLTQGLTPSRLHPSAEITATINSAAALDLSQCPANSVLTLSLPLGGVDLQTLAQLERAYAASGVGMLQLNCVDQAQLLDARAHPERHPELIVRLYGYSARFVNLTPEMQDEFISRTLYGGSCRPPGSPASPTSRGRPTGAGAPG